MRLPMTVMEHAIHSAIVRGVARPGLGDHGKDGRQHDEVFFCLRYDVANFVNGYPMCHF